MSTTTTTIYNADINPPVCSLNIRLAWNNLTKSERFYAHYLSRANWFGSRIILNQSSHHSQLIFNWILIIFNNSHGNNTLTDLSSLQQNAGLNDVEFNHILDYSAQILSNLSEFKSFGSVKFIPNASPISFQQITNTAQRKEEAQLAWSKIKDVIFKIDVVAENTIGKPSSGHISAYYSPAPNAPTDAQVNEVTALCNAAGVETFNTRLTKQSDKAFTLLIASASTVLPESYPATLESKTLGFVLTLQGGDFAESMAAINSNLREAVKYAANENQKLMLKDYIESFEHGSVAAHIEGSRKWVKDVGPVIENYIGFIETYQDPYAARAEFEGFVAIVNKEQSRKFEKLVNKAEHLIKDLPWGPDFEVAKFQRPDFTALEILTFATGGVPAGINIPNYHQVRESDGFKNVSLSNILSAKAAGEECTFIDPNQVDEYRKWESVAFEVQVANHELLGHGTGRIFTESTDGKFNFDRTLINPLTGRVIENWYKPGESYGSKIGPVSSSMEECRAESVALYLSSNREILSIFNFNTQEEADDLTYWTFVIMARAGVRALEFYDPTTGKHGQAHMEARMGITLWLIEHGLVTLSETYSSSGELTNAHVVVDRQKVLESGKAIMGKLLIELQVRRSTGDGAGATIFYSALTKPNEHWSNVLRPLVLSKKLPRKIFVQPNTVLTTNEQGEVDVVLKEYEVSVRGVVESFVERGL